MIFKVVSLC